VAHKSKLSFQYGFKVRLLTLVVLVCSPLIVATANGSGKPALVNRLLSLRKTGEGGGERTEDISFVEPIGCDDCFVCQ
jgi:hypothetical protein